jgi:lactoylglutathione lyase
MKIIAVNHITINVEDLEKSEQFYSNVMGLEKTGFIHMGDHTLTYFRLTDETRLELIRYLTPVKKADTAETDQKIYRHFCVETDDIDMVYQTCVNHGVLVRKTPSYVEKLKCSNMLIVDPNGVEIEIMQN